MEIGCVHLRGEEFGLIGAYRLIIINFSVMNFF